MCKKSWELYLIIREKTLSNIKECSIFKQTMGKKRNRVEEEDSLKKKKKMKKLKK